MINKYVAAICLASGICVHATTAAAPSPPVSFDVKTPPDLNTRARGPIRPVDLSTFPATFHSEFVAGPASGFDPAYLVLSRVPAGFAGPALHTHPADQFYFILQGQMHFQLGTDTFTAGPKTLVMIPAGTPHRNWNTTTEEELHVELIVPPPPIGQLLSPAEPRKIENAAGLIRKAADAPPAGEGGFDVRWLARRETGSQHMALHYDEVQPKSGGPGLHIHAFDQVYFVIEGTMNVQLGLKTYQVKPYSYVIIPAGTVHRQWNEGPGIEKHLTLLLPEPDKDAPLDVAVEIKGNP